ncbi:glycosyltransferase [Anaeromyxobacter diazotrophicus]|uniref:Glycosyl transferase family 1 n=1 Tax=Anaeromyxobacter diazotrophicus TaxID=2590199 RepID=A0A7I9VIT8_9BACT|nr:glycosyltransferase [Anaeromyxobacter diazotrophicus]GEJ56263.1 glycosyl transferase family 1 [Anaeromyxobacter diazotrophicus]
MSPPRLRVVEFTNCFHVGGGEVQVLELLRRLPASYQVSLHALDRSGPLLEETRALGYEPIVHPLGGSFMRPAALAETMRLGQWLRRERIDLVHAHDFYAALLAVPAARMAGVPVAVSRLDLVHWHGRARHLAFAAASHAADVVVANCEAVRDLVVHVERVAPEKAIVIRNGLDLPRFDALRAAPLQGPLPDTGAAPLAILVANMRHEVKRHEDFLAAFAQVRRGVPEAQALLVGEGRRQEQLAAHARELGLEGAVHFLGARKDVPALLARATFGVLCSRQEGLSNAVMEGMAAGLPMVVTDAGGNAELVKDGARGFVVPPERPDALAQAMLRILADPARARRMGQAARRFVEEELGLDRMIAEHDRLYRRLARRAEAARAA